MTGRIRTLTVHLDDDYRDEEESVGVIMDAIEMIKCVDSVEKGESVSHVDYSARRDFRHHMGMLISSLALSDDKDFVDECQLAYEKMKKKRGY